MVGTVPHVCTYTATLPFLVFMRQSLKLTIIKKTYFSMGCGILKQKTNILPKVLHAEEDLHPAVGGRISPRVSPWFGMLRRPCNLPLWFCLQYMKKPLHSCHCRWFNWFSNLNMYSRKPWDPIFRRFHGMPWPPNGSLNESLDSRL